MNTPLTKESLLLEAERLKNDMSSIGDLLSSLEIDLLMTPLLRTDHATRNSVQELHRLVDAAGKIMMVVESRCHLLAFSVEKMPNE